MNSLKDKNKLEFVLGVDDKGEVLTRDLRHYGTLGVYLVVQEVERQILLNRC